MIKDKLENASLYYNISESLKKGFEWLKSKDLINIECGKYEIEGEKIYANIQEYKTKTEAKYESHRKYIDIQYMIKGCELIGVTDLSNCVTCVEYDCDKDLEFYNIKTDEEFLKLSDGDFLIFFPQDAHKPSIACNTTSVVKKVVVKVFID